MNNTKNTIQLPGKKIKKHELGVNMKGVRRLFQPNETDAMGSELLENLDQSLLNKTLLPPTLSAILTRDKKDGVLQLKVDIFALIQSRLNLSASKDANSFTFHYDLKLNFDDKYELIIYVAFGHKRNFINMIERDLTQYAIEVVEELDGLSHINFQEFDTFYFPLVFDEKAFIDFIPPVKNRQSDEARPKRKLITKINTVRVFMVDENNCVTLDRRFRDTVVSVFKNTKNKPQKEYRKDGKKLIVTEIEIPKNDPRITVLTPTRLIPDPEGWPTLQVNRLLPPIPFVTRNTKGEIVITSAVLIRNDLNIQSEDFIYYYGLELEEHNESVLKELDCPYQLNHYITYDSCKIQSNKKDHRKAKKKNTTFDIYYFQVIFKEDIKVTLPANSLSCQNSDNSITVPLKSVRSAKVYHVDVDPNTSRGTETTVQEGGGNG